MRSLVALTLSVSFALPAASQTLLSEVSGNWAGASNQGFYFLARLSQNEDKARLQIWGGATDAVPSGEGDPEFDNAEIALGAFATRQELEVVDTGNGSILQIVTEFADEEAEGRSVVQLQYLDNQYTVVGYFFQELLYNAPNDPVPYQCELDLQNGTATVNGQTQDLPPMAAAELNASDWTFSSAFDRGFCPRG